MKAATTAACPPNPVHEPIRDRLRRRLLALNYHAFVRCLCLLLTRLGYEDVQVAGRTKWKGRNCEGGYDIEASLPVGAGRRRIIVQAKQFDTLPVFQRSVDELRGTCLRAGATEGLLITTSAFSPVVLRNAEAAGAQVAPVRLLDGSELLDLLISHRIGVWEEAGGSASEPCRSGLDESFFDELSQTFAGNTCAGNTCTGNTYTGNARLVKGHCQERHPIYDDKRPFLSLTIRVDLPGPAGNWTLTGKGIK